MPLPSLSPIPFKNLEFRNGMGLRLGNGIYTLVSLQKFFSAQNHHGHWPMSCKPSVKVVGGTIYRTDTFISDGNWVYVEWELSVCCIHDTIHSKCVCISGPTCPWDYNLIVVIQLFKTASVFRNQWNVSFFLDLQSPLPHHSSAMCTRPSMSSVPWWMPTITFLTRW